MDRSVPARAVAALAGLLVAVPACAGPAAAPGPSTGAAVTSTAGTDGSPAGEASVTPGTPPAAGPTSSPDATATPAPRPRRSFTLVATGDVLPHPPLWRQAERDAGGRGMDFAPQLAGVRPLVKAADLAVCHLETPLARPGGPFAGYPTFSSPPQILKGITDTGYDACTTASNHTFDRGAAGVDRTLDALDAAGIAHAGSARTPAEARRTTMLAAGRGSGRVRVALLSYTYGFNGIPYPDGQRWRAPLIDKDRVLADAGRARRRGAEVVVVALHWGQEYVHEPTAEQRRLARRLLASPDVDLLLGHHAHVVQPLERRGGEWVAYGLGNLVAAHRTPAEANAEGLLVRFRFSERAGGRFAVTQASYAPLLVTDPYPLRVLDVARALRTGRHPGTTESRLRQAWTRTTRVVNSRGAHEDGLRPISTPPSGA